MVHRVDGVVLQVQTDTCSLLLSTALEEHALDILAGGSREEVVQCIVALCRRVVVELPLSLSIFLSLSLP